MQTDDHLTGYVFTRAELARLTAYRAAVQSGFYNEGYSATDAQNLATSINERERRRLRTVERKRLVALREAVRAGLYSDDGATD